MTGQDRETPEHFRIAVVERVADMMGWHRKDAANIVGDPTEQYNEGLSVVDAADEIVAAAAAEH